MLSEKKKLVNVVRDVPYLSEVGTFGTNVPHYLNGIRRIKRIFKPKTHITPHILDNKKDVAEKIADMEI